MIIFWRPCIVSTDFPCEFEVALAETIMNHILYHKTHGFEFVKTLGLTIKYKLETEKFSESYKMNFRSKVPCLPLACTLCLACLPLAVSRASPVVSRCLPLVGGHGRHFSTSRFFESADFASVAGCFCRQ